MPAYETYEANCKKIHETYHEMRFRLTNEYNQKLRQLNQDEVICIAEEQCRLAVAQETEDFE